MAAAIPFLLTAPMTAAQDAPVSPKTFYDPQDVMAVTWTYGKKSVSLKKNVNGQWQKAGDKSHVMVDPWALQRRLSALSRFVPTVAAKLQSPLGHVEVKTAQQTFEGDYDELHFQWNLGDNQHEGFIFSTSTDLHNLMGEGVQGFDAHSITLCEPDKVESLLVSPLWTLTKKNKTWVLKNNDEKESAARFATAQAVVSQFCQLKVDYFVANSSSDNEVVVINERNKKNPVIISNSSGFYFIVKVGAFLSKSLDRLLQLPAIELQDPAVELSKIAINPALSARERVDAIHKLKSEGSPAGIPALKTLVTEQTDVDVFRYEAIEALQNIGTKEAFKIIADRLENATPSGFQLKLARALSSSMGHPFLSGDNTPEGERQVEIRGLLDAYRKKPIGK